MDISKSILTLSEFRGTSQCLKSLLWIILQPDKLLKMFLKAINVPVLHTFNFLVYKFMIKITNRSSGQHGSGGKHVSLPHTTTPKL